MLAFLTIRRIVDLFRRRVRFSRNSARKIRSEYSGILTPADSCIVTMKELSHGEEIVTIEHGLRGHIGKNLIDVTRLRRLQGQMRAGRSNAGTGSSYPMAFVTGWLRVCRKQSYVPGTSFNTNSTWTPGTQSLAAFVPAAPSGDYPMRATGWKRPLYLTFRRCGAVILNIAYRDKCSGSRGYPCAVSHAGKMAVDARIYTVIVDQP